MEIYGNMENAKKSLIAMIAFVLGIMAFLFGLGLVGYSFTLNPRYVYDLLGVSAVGSHIFSVGLILTVAGAGLGLGGLIAGRRRMTS